MFTRLVVLAIWMVGFGKDGRVKVKMSIDDTPPWERDGEADDAADEEGDDTSDPDLFRMSDDDKPPWLRDADSDDAQGESSGPHDLD